jgi:hypothetical protein
MGQQCRKKLPPAVREAQGNGLYLRAHGAPHDPCPVAGCHGTLLFLHRRGQSYVVCSLQPHTHGRPSPWGEDEAWWRHPAQQSPYRGAVNFSAEQPASPTGLDRQPFQYDHLCAISLAVETCFPF